MIQEGKLSIWDDLLEHTKQHLLLHFEDKDSSQSIDNSDLIDLTDSHDEMPEDSYIEYHEPTLEDWNTIIFPEIQAQLRKDRFLKSFEIEEWLRRIDVKSKEQGITAAIDMYQYDILLQAPIPVSIRKFVPRKVFHQGDEGFYTNNGPKGSKLYLKKYMYSQIKEIQATKLHGINLRSYTDNFNWTLNFHSFDGSSNLGETLTRLYLLDMDIDLTKDINASLRPFKNTYQSQNKIKPEIVVEIKFPFDFPRSTPLIRIVSPSFVDFGEAALREEMIKFLNQMKESNDNLGLSDHDESLLSAISLKDMIVRLRNCFVTKNPETDLSSATFGNSTVNNAWYTLAACSPDDGYPDIEATGRMYLPSTILSDMYSNSVVNLAASGGNASPMIFEIYNPDNDKRAYGGILEFTAQEGTVVIPSWLRESIGLGDSSLVEVRRVVIPKCTFIKIKAYLPENMEKDFNVKAMLEWKLRDYMALTTGQILNFKERGYSFKFEVLEVKPGHYVAITDSDITVELITENEKEPLSAEPMDQEADNPTEVLTSGYADNSAETKQCDNCLSFIPVENYMIHTLTCRTTNYKCEKCGMIVKKSDHKNHENEYHSMVQCAKCGTDVERSKLSWHETNECCERSTKCRFCEMSLSHKELYTHEASCGNITEICEHCNARIMRKNKTGHLEIGCEMANKLASQDFDQPKTINNIDNNRGGLTRSIFVCEKCQEPIEGFDELQVHYLTSHSEESDVIEANL